MTVYYNEIDPYAAQWLRNLISAGHIAPGVVDERSIEDVKPNELNEFTQCHFFAGIGGWSLALRLAGWPDDRPAWTGSCPCQPFSAAGKGSGFDDERHLWPAFHWLIAQCRPATIFGEQVASGAAKDWLDLVSNDLENLGYAFGAVALPACGIGAPHIRQRTWWVADDTSKRWNRGKNTTWIARRIVAEAMRSTDRLADNKSVRLERSGSKDNARSNQGNSSDELDGRLGYSGVFNCSDWLYCRDGKYRPVEPGLKPLAHGIPNRVGRLRAYGNAIVPQVAAEIIKAYTASEYTEESCVNLLVQQLKLF